MTIAHDILISRGNGQLQTSINGCVVLMPVESGNYFSLNQPASDIWSAIETPIAFGDLLSRMAGKYQTSPDAIAADVEELLAGLAAGGLVTIGR